MSQPWAFPYQLSYYFIRTHDIHVTFLKFFFYMSCNKNKFPMLSFLYFLPTMSQRVNETFSIFLQRNEKWNEINANSFFLVFTFHSFHIENTMSCRRNVTFIKFTITPNVTQSFKFCLLFFYFIFFSPLCAFVSPKMSIFLYFFTFYSSLLFLFSVTALHFLLFRIFFQ